MNFDFNIQWRNDFNYPIWYSEGKYWLESNLILNSTRGSCVQIFFFFLKRRVFSIITNFSFFFNLSYALSFPYPSISNLVDGAVMSPVINTSCNPAAFRFCTRQDISCAVVVCQSPRPNKIRSALGAPRLSISCYS